MWKLRKTSHTHQAKHYRLHCSACWRTLMFGTNIACKLLGRRGCAWAGLCPPAQWSRGSSLGMDSGADTWITTQVIWIFLFKWKFCSSHRQFLQCYDHNIEQDYVIRGKEPFHGRQSVGCDHMWYMWSKKWIFWRYLFFSLNKLAEKVRKLLRQNFATKVSKLSKLCKCGVKRAFCGNIQWN